MYIGWIIRGLFATKRTFKCCCPKLLTVQELFDIFEKRKRIFAKQIVDNKTLLESMKNGQFLR